MKDKNSIINKLNALFASRSERKVTVKQIEDFYKYSEIAKWRGASDNTGQFGGGISIIDENVKQKYIYEGIMLYGDKKWAFISIDDENVKYQYTENIALNYITVCPTITDKKMISQLSEIIYKWYKKLNLPKEIENIQNNTNGKESFSVLQEIHIECFDGIVLRILSNKMSFLIFNTFPPHSKKISKYQIEHFEKILADAIGEKVIHDDRELFVIFNDSQKMVNDVLLFFKKFQ
ncbi:hypothetical protein FACS189430_04020 [Bacteroidia bacterium]|nr:hypothetical protein FACS189430_04020 [Bacteroidia bacterium]